MMSRYSPFPIHSRALCVQGLGVHERMPPCVLTRPNGWPHFLFVSFYDPTHCATRSKAAEVPAGTFVCWRPGTPHALGRADKTWNHSWLSVSGHDVARVIREAKLPTDRPLPLHDLAFFDAALAELHVELSRPPDGSDSIDARLTRGLVGNVIRRLARAARSPSPRPAVPRPLIEIRHYLQERLHEPIALGDLAERAGLSVSQLCLLHKQHFGGTVHDGPPTAKVICTNGSTGLNFF